MDSRGVTKKPFATEDYARKAEVSLRRLVRLHLGDAKVWLFGSRATGRAKRRSDFDVAYLPGEDFDRASVVRLGEAIEESDMIYGVDLVDLSGVSEEFRRKVLREGISWKS